MDFNSRFIALAATGKMYSPLTGCWSNQAWKEHPLVKHELAARSFVVRTLARLGLDVDHAKPVGRPGSGGIGWKPYD
jgi:hypothetical protein